MRFVARDGCVWDTQTGERVVECVMPHNAPLVASAMNRGYAIGVPVGHEEARRTFLGMAREMGKGFEVEETVEEAR